MGTRPERSNCVFCNIANKLEDTEILYEDDEICVFRDIKPASSYHILTIPKRHIEDAKCLTSADKELVMRMLSVSKEMLTKNNLTLNDARFGYHWPPFRSVHHLHLHTIAPESKMGFIARMIFKKDSYWFVSLQSTTKVLYTKKQTSPNSMGLRHLITKFLAASSQYIIRSAQGCNNIKLLSDLYMHEKVSPQSLTGKEIEFNSQDLFTDKYRDSRN